MENYIKFRFSLFSFYFRHNQMLYEKLLDIDQFYLMFNFYHKEGSGQINYYSFAFNLWKQIVNRIVTRLYPLRWFLSALTFLC